MIPSGPHSFGDKPIPGGRYTAGRWRVHVRNVPRTDRAAYVAVMTPTGFPLAVMDLETTTDLEAIENARLFACAPRMVAALHDLGAYLEAAGFPDDNPARALVRDTLNTVLRVPTEAL